MKKYVEKRKMTMESLRGLCVRNDWYTSGTNAEYDKLLMMTKADDITTDVLVRMANDILIHSETDHYMESVLFELSRICYSVFEKEGV